ncbi:MAG: helix-turn-helix transcriptional regulator [Alphaproteobacteria bacterium]|nr:helix-turn-helix transcriptional regulator [Alphaproteobacteria bacterium]
MSGSDLFERVLHSLHAAAFDDDRWPAASALIGELCGAKGNVLVSGDGAPADGVDVFFARVCYRGQFLPEWQREYFEDFHALDERIPRLRHLPDSLVVHASSLYTEEERKTSPAWNEALRRSDTQDSLNVRLDGPGGSRIVWAVGDPVDKHGWLSSRVRAVERLLPHLRQFVQVRQALVDARALGASALDLLDNDRLGVIRLDRRARVTTANDRARALLNEPGGLYDRNRFLRATRPLEDRKLQSLLAQALPLLGGTGGGGSMPVSRAAPLPRFALHVSPVSGGGERPPRSRIGALVLLSDPAARAAIDPRLVQEALGLTPAESRIAVRLAQARTIDDIAAETGRSRTTVKWHMRHIYDKHGLRRQVELAQLVMALADLPGMRR